jgi:hypothetical protein
MNIKNFDFVLTLPSGLQGGMSSFTHSITILPSRRTSRKNKIKNLFNL